jgi:3-deoxy-D-manno-octulosonate 8-phosphate phosphatase (KDO 8-P phosphatase)
MPDPVERARTIRLVIFDVDGVFTDGRLFYSPDGEEIKVFHVRDGVGVKALTAAGVETAVISGRASDAVTLRMGELGIRRVFQGDHDKMPLFRDILADLHIRPDETAFLGDDLPDLPVMAVVGLAGCPADAHHTVKEVCHWVGRKTGGRGVVREFCDFLIEARQPASGGGS